MVQWQSVESVSQKIKEYGNLSSVRDTLPVEERALSWNFPQLLKTTENVGG